MAEDRPLLIRASDRARIPEEKARHPLNPNSEIRGWSLSDLVGLKRCGLYLIRIPPGKESFILHSHHVQEEFMYVLEGRGMARIGDEEHEVGPGDFIGFPTPSVAHHLRNPFAEELVYLSGGEKGEFEVADFPGIGKRLVRAGKEVKLYPLAAGEPLSYAPEQPAAK
jgi:uncharacterized cupin superfamily protein